jgi:hypothetical protein
MAKKRSKSSRISQRKSRGKKPTVKQTLARSSQRELERELERRKARNQLKTSPALRTLRNRIEKAKAGKKPTKIEGTGIRKIEIPGQARSMAKFMELAEKNREGFNALKNDSEYFGFTIEGNQSRTVFRDVGEAARLMRAYIKNGSGATARIGLYRVKGKPQSWRPAKAVASRKGLSAAVKSVNRRHRRHVRRKVTTKPYIG